MATFDGNIVISVLRAALGVKRAGFGLINIMTDEVEATFTEKYRVYEKNSDAQADDDLKTIAKALVAAFFGEDKHPAKVMLSKKAANQAQVDTHTVSGTWAEGDIANITVTPNGGSAITGTHTCGASETPTTVATALRTDLTTKLAAEDITVGGSTDDVTLTADNPGEPFNSTNSVTSAAGVITKVETTPNIGFSSTLAALEVDYSDWYGLCIDSRDKVDIRATAVWAEANRKRFWGQTSDADAKAKTAGNILEWLKGKGYTRTVISWHHDDAEYMDIHWAADYLSADPDLTATVAADRNLTGVTANADSDVDSTEKQNIEDQNGNLYLTDHGTAVTGPGKSADGSWVDVGLTCDWIEARLGEDAAQLKQKQASINKKIPYTQEGLDMVEKIMRVRGQHGIRVKHFGKPDADTPAFAVTKKTMADVTAGEKTSREITREATAYTAGAGYKITITLAVLT